MKGSFEQIQTEHGYGGAGALHPGVAAAGMRGRSGIDGRKHKTCHGR